MGSVSNFFSDIDFYNWINAMQSGGWFQFVFPFLLVYSIVFSITEYMSIFKEKKPVRVIIALVVSLFAIAFPIASNGNTLGDLMIVLFPGVTAFTMAILALYIIAGMMGVNLLELLGDKGGSKIVKGVIAGLGIFVIAFYYGKGFGLWDAFGIPNWIEDLFTDPLLYIIVVFGLLFYWISKDDTKSGDSKPSSRKTTRIEEEN